MSEQKAPFKREWRYVVLKRKDISNYLTSNEQGILNILARCVVAGRAGDKKPPLTCVVVEQDWPEYEPVWNMIEARMTAAPASETNACDCAASRCLHEKTCASLRQTNAASASETGETDWVLRAAYRFGKRLQGPGKTPANRRKLERRQWQSVHRSYPMRGKDRRQPNAATQGALQANRSGSEAGQPALAPMTERERDTMPAQNMVKIQTLVAAAPAPSKLPLSAEDIGEIDKDCNSYYARLSHQALIAIEQEQRIEELEQQVLAKGAMAEGIRERCECLEREITELKGRKA